MPVRYITQRSNPRPNPEWRVEPYLRRSKIEVIIFFFSPSSSIRFSSFSIILSLASTDDLTDSRHQTVHSCNGLVIVVQLHVECFNLLRIIRHEYRPFEDLLLSDNAHAPSADRIPMLLCIQIYHCFFSRRSLQLLCK